MKFREKALNYSKASLSSLFCSEVCKSHLQFQYFAGNYSYTFATWGMSRKDILSCIFCLVSANPSVCDLQRRGFGRVSARWTGWVPVPAARPAWLATGRRNHLRVLVCHGAWLPSARHKTWANLCFQKWRRACSPHTLSVFTRGSGIFESVFFPKKVSVIMLWWSCFIKFKFTNLL